MSERLPRTQPEALALARWTALLMGWVWLGAQGQRLGWSVVSGVLPLALWWALRLLLTHTGLTGGLAARLAPAAAPLLGAFTALGTLLVGQWQTPATGHAALLLLAAVWAAWSAALKTPLSRGACRRRWAGLPPLLAAALTVLGTAAVLPAAFSLWAAPGVLLLAAVLGQRPPTYLTQRTTMQAFSAASAVPATAMGLMMGTLWLSNAWCSAAGWSPTAVVALHLGLMGALPTLTRWGALPQHIPAPWADRLPLALVALGAAVLLVGTGAAHGVVGMGLLALAWSVHAGRQQAEAWTIQPAGATVLVLSALSGPGLLLAVGWLSPTTGPWAQQLAYGLIGGAALLTLVFSGWRRSPPRPLRLSIPLTRSDST